MISWDELEYLWRQGPEEVKGLFRRLAKDASLFHMSSLVNTLDRAARPGDSFYVSRKAYVEMHQDLKVRWWFGFEFGSRGASAYIQITNWYSRTRDSSIPTWSTQFEPACMPAAGPRHVSCVEQALAFPDDVVCLKLPDNRVLEILAEWKDVNARGPEYARESCLRRIDLLLTTGHIQLTEQPGCYELKPQVSRTEHHA